MNNLSIRGLEDKALDALKRRAAQQQGSGNTLVLQLINQSLGLQRAKPGLTRQDDLDALAGTWTARDAEDFEQATTAFGKIDATLWK